MPVTNSKDNHIYRIKSLEKVLAILQSLAQAGEPLGAAECAELSGMPKATVHRLLSAMALYGLVYRESDQKKYSLGLQLIQLGTAAEQSSSTLALVADLLKNVSNSSGETAHLATLKDGRVEYIVKSESTSELRMPSRVGGTNFAHCTGVGKALLSGLRDTEVAEMLEAVGYPRLTSKTVGSLDALLEQLKTVREKGYAIDDEELEIGLRCIAVPVQGRSNRVFAAVSVSGPTTRLKPNRYLEIVELLVSVAERLVELENVIHPLRKV